MNLGFSIKECGKKLSLDFGREIESKKKYLSELIEDKVILDLKNARKLLEEKGNVEIYEVFNLWKFNYFAKKFLKNFGLMIDITLLKHGVFSVERDGEAFCTYGHVHEKNLGEVYQVLKNYCFLLLSDRTTFKSYLIKLKEGCSFFIPPSFMHRLISGKKDCVVLNFVPEDAGHNYDIVKNRGFPFHVFYIGNRTYFKENEKYPKTSLVLINDVKKFDVLKLAERQPRYLKKVLRKSKNIYTLAKDYL